MQEQRDSVKQAFITLIFYPLCEHKITCKIFANGFVSGKSLTEKEEAVQAIFFWVQGCKEN